MKNILKHQCKVCNTENILDFSYKNKSHCDNCIYIKSREQKKKYNLKYKERKLELDKLRIETKIRICSKCKETNQNNFSKSCVYYCRKCQSKRTLNGRKSKIKNGDYSTFFRYTITNAIKRAKKKNLEFDISILDLEKLLVKQNYKCYYTGLIFNTNDKKYTISVDRVDSTKGYILDNIVLCCWFINEMKKNYLLVQFKELIKIVYFNYIVEPKIEFVQNLESLV